MNMLKNHTPPFTIQKVKAHTNKKGNEKADALFVTKNIKENHLPSIDYEHTHSTPCYLLKNDWLLP